MAHTHTHTDAHELHLKTCPNIHAQIAVQPMSMSTSNICSSSGSSSAKCISNGRSSHAETVAMFRPCCCCCCCLCCGLCCCCTPATHCVCAVRSYLEILFGRLPNTKQMNAAPKRLRHAREYKHTHRHTHIQTHTCLCTHRQFVLQIHA